MSMAFEFPVSVFEREQMDLRLASTAGDAAFPASSAATEPPKAPAHCPDCIRARALSPRELAHRMRQSNPFLLLDCRSFIAYNLGHINGALNISCADRFTRRRLAGGRARVGDLVSGTDSAKDIYQELWEADFVLYDDNTSDPSVVLPSNPLHTVLSALRKEGKEPYLLTGGLQAFQCQFSELCSKLPADVERPKRLVSPTTPVIHNKIETTSATQILPFLYLGNERDVRNQSLLESMGITHVLNVTSHVPHHFEEQGLVYKRLPATDSCHQNLRQYFLEAFEFIDAARKSGGRVLVHCQAGVSRSATVTVAYLMKKTSLAMTEAYRYVKSKRDIIAPNFNFMGQLMEFEQALTSGQISRETELAPLVSAQ